VKKQSIERLLLPKHNKSLSAVFAISTLSIATIFSLTSVAQSFASIDQIRSAAKSNCTFEKEKTVIYEDENGVEQEKVEYYDELDYDCTEREYGGQLVQGNFYLKRAKKTWHSGSVVTLQGNGYTAFCKDADAEVEWFETNGEPENFLTVRANFDGLKPGVFSEDVNLENCNITLN
jgi:hypothetical protein